MAVRRDLHEANRLSWNAGTRAHNAHRRDQAAFFRRGGSTLFPEEISLLGDLKGKKLVHLQCNSGQDSLSLASRGAAVTGVDISDEAITFARQLSRDSDVPARFVRADIYDWFQEGAAERPLYDLAFSSYGALPWLSDLGVWAEGVASVLRPGGRFVSIEFHPFVWMLDVDWRLRFDFFPPAGESSSSASGVSDYVADARGLLSPSGHIPDPGSFSNPHPSFEFQWPVSAVVTALVEAGFRIERLAEYPYANGWMPFPNMRSDEHRRTWPPPGVPALPLMYSLSASKPAP